MIIDKDLKILSANIISRAHFCNSYSLQDTFSNPSVLFELSKKQKYHCYNIRNLSLLHRNLDPSSNRVLSTLAPHSLFFFFLNPSATSHLPPPPIPSSSCLWPRNAPSPSCEGDRGRNGHISPCGPPSSSLPFFFSFFPVLIRTRQATTSTLLFPLVMFSLFLLCSGHVLVGFARAHGWLVTPAVSLFFYGKIGSSCRWRDLQRPWMLRRQWVWGLLPYRAFVIQPDLGVDLSKLLLLESPKTRIAWYLMLWTIRFDFLVGCSYENLVPSFLSFQTSPTTTALAIYQTVIKPCFVYCSCVVIRCFSWVFLLLLLLLLLLLPSLQGYVL